jgi:hypothetical protein
VKYLNIFSSLIFCQRRIVACSDSSFLALGLIGLRFVRVHVFFFFCGQPFLLFLLVFLVLELIFWICGWIFLVCELAFWFVRTLMSLIFIFFKAFGLFFLEGSGSF